MATPPPGETESALTYTYKWLHRHFPHIVDCEPIDAPARIVAAGFEAPQWSRSASGACVSSRSSPGGFEMDGAWTIIGGPAAAREGSACPA
jgi:hypothetical protein